MGGLGVPELAVIISIAVLIFGPRQLPKLGKSIGETIREFRKVGKELTETKEEVEDTVREVKRDLGVRR